MNPNNYKEYIRRAYGTACRNGFHDEEKSLNHFLMLAITEVAEMVEADRKGNHAIVMAFKIEISKPQEEEYRQIHWRALFDTYIKDSYEDEMADVCIRLFDLAGLMDWTPNYMYAAQYNELYKDFQERYRKFSVAEKSYELCKILASFREGKCQQICFDLPIAFLCCWAKSEGIDLEWHINQKMAYNEQRARLHGKRY